MRQNYLPIIDITMVNISFFFCSSLLKIDSYQVSTSLIFSVIFILCCKFSGVYKIAIRHVGIALLKLGLFSSVVALLFVLVINGFDQVGFYVFSSMFSLCSVVLLRVVAREYYFATRQVKNTKTLIYGAGSAGVQFATATLQGDIHKVVGFVDDSVDLVGSYIHGCEVFATSQIEKLVIKHNVEIIVLAMPSLNGAAKRSIINKLIELPVRVVTVPTLAEILSGRAPVSNTQDVEVEDILGRDIVPPEPHLLRSRISGKTILVTGAGGSIGSEICLQIAQLDAKQLILMDVSEVALFEIEQTLRNTTNVNLTCVLGSVLDSVLLHKTFQKYKIDTVFHAAAYKHVPMLEDNQRSAFINNVDGTINVLAEAVKSSCTSFTLVSTDKAVRPTNVMGVSKRVAELVCQAKAEKSHSTVISMVRFGNVLNSSGSVIRTFGKQIASGGPVTITHRDVTRYFMTVTEAAQLVIQSAGMAKGGDVFILDMGEPMKIYDLAKRMIRLSGRNHYDDGGTPQDNSSIKLEFIGLRPGEKLFEELLIDATALKTGHPKIMRAKEEFLDEKSIENYVKCMKASLDNGDFDLFSALLAEAKTGYSKIESNVKN